MSAISVVIPTYNVENYLDDCLASLRSQTFTDFDVVIVNDGSTDSSGEIADRWASEDARFTVVHQANSGPGPGGGRNGGLAFTKSDLLMFVDSDDALLPDAFARLVHAFEQDTEVEVVTTSACRLVGAMTRPSHFHDVSHPFEQLSTTVAQSPWLMFDSTPWNKAFRRPFFDRIVGEWPAQQLYEDIAPMTTALVHAKAITVLSDQHYLWRTRGEGSITHESLSIKGDLAQLEQLRLAREQVTATGNDELLQWFDWKSITSDMLWMVRKLPRTEGETRHQLHTALRTALSTIDSAQVEAVQPGLRRCYESIRSHAADETVQVIARNRLSLNQDRRSPHQALHTTPGTASVQLVRTSPQKLTLAATSRDVDLSAAQLVLSPLAPWAPEPANLERPSNTTVTPSKATRAAATFSVSRAQLDDHGSVDLYVGVRTGDDANIRELKRSIVDVARSRLTPPRKTSATAAIPFFDDSWLRLAVGTRPLTVTSVANQDGWLVCAGPRDTLDLDEYMAFLTETGSNKVASIEFAWSGDRAMFEVRVSPTQRQQLGSTPYFLSLAAPDNPAIPLPLAIARPVTVAFGRHGSKEQIRVDHGSQAQAFVQRHTSPAQRARHLVNEVRAKQIFSGLRPSKSKN